MKNHSRFSLLKIKNTSAAKPTNTGRGKQKYTKKLSSKWPRRSASKNRKISAMAIYELTPNTAPKVRLNTLAIIENLNASFMLIYSFAKNAYARASKITIKISKTIRGENEPAMLMIADFIGSKGE